LGEKLKKKILNMKTRGETTKHRKSIGDQARDNTREERMKRGKEGAGDIVGLIPYIDCKKRV